MTYLGEPLGPHVLKGGRIDQGETDEKYIRLGIGQRSQAIVILLTRRIPESQVNGLGIHHHIGRIVVENGGYILAGKGVGRIADQQAGLTHRSVAHNHTLDGLHDEFWMG